MATQFEYDKLKAKYAQFQFPKTVIFINNKDVAKIDANIKVTNVNVDLTSGFEATMASFVLVGYYNTETNMFLTTSFNEKVKLGMGVKIAVGYGNEALDVFYGYITHINFVYHGSEGVPGIKITCMDVKAAMMSNRQTKQFKGCTCYSDAVKKIIEGYKALDKTKPKLTELKIFDTPDKPEKQPKEDTDTDVSIEMTDETDYEFCVRAARKFNYEFFCHCGTIYFRAAKSDKDSLIVLSLMGLNSIDIEYTNVGITGAVEVRAINADDGTLIHTTVKNPNKNTFLFPDSKRVFIDPTIHSVKEAEYRANYLMEENSYKHCTLRATMVGLPEMTPGRYFEMLFTQEKVLKLFYLTEVRHIFDGSGTYTTEIVARSCNSFEEKK